MEKKSLNINIPTTLMGKLENYSQNHLIDRIKAIANEKERNEFISFLEKIDYELMSQLFKLYQTKSKVKLYEAKDLSPITSMYSKHSFKESELEEIMSKGYEYISTGKVGLLILAGGLGTRLGFDKSKGMFNLLMPSNKSLFEYVSNRFLSVQNLAKKKTGNSKPCPLFIMTSEQNHNEIISFFKENNYFLLDPDNIFFFPQNEICGLTLDGKIISTEAGKLFRGPDGNGGCFTAMKKHGIINECIKRGVEYLNVISIDNPLTKTLDPLFIGVNILKGKGEDQMSAKVIKRTDPFEKMGNFLNYKKRPMMIDYMELPEENKTLKNDKEELVYCASNVLDYMISVSFLKKVLMDESKFNKLINEFHPLKKKFEITENINGNVVKKTIDGVKFEIFYNSIFEFAEEGGLLLLEVERDQEYAPIKNHDNEPTMNPTITRKKLSNFYKQWYIKSGGQLHLNEDVLMEISFLISYDGEDLFAQDVSKIPKEINDSNVQSYNDRKGVFFKNEKLE